MSWRKETGEARWSGTDRVVNILYDTCQVNWHVSGYIYIAWVFVCASALTAIPYILVQLLFGVGSVLGQLAAFAVFGAGAAVIVRLSFSWFERKFPVVPRFYTRRWELVGANGKLTLKAGGFDGKLDAAEVTRRKGASWSVAIDRIERVEAGLTCEWLPARRYPGAPTKQLGHERVPTHEYQTYLHLDDGSRRVIFTINAEREASATLALSIRNWIENERRKNVCETFGLSEGFAV